MGFIGFFVKLIFIPINNIIGAHTHARPALQLPPLPLALCTRRCLCARELTPYCSHVCASQSAWADAAAAGRPACSERASLLVWVCLSAFERGGWRTTARARARFVRFLCSQFVLPKILYACAVPSVTFSASSPALG